MPARSPVELELGVELPGTRFASLLRELAAEHANEVSALNRGLDEARAEVDRLRKAGETDCSTDCLPAVRICSDEPTPPVAEQAQPPQEDGPIQNHHDVGHVCTTQSDAYELERTGESKSTGGGTDSALVLVEGPPEGTTRTDVDSLGMQVEKSCSDAVVANSSSFSRLVNGAGMMLFRAHDAPFHEMKMFTEKTMSAMSEKFDMIIGFCIVLNALVMALEIEYTGLRFKKQELDECDGCGRVPLVEDMFLVLENMFTAIFFVELVVRLKMEGYRYLCLLPNFMDSMIVLVSIVDSWVLAPLGDDSMGNVAVLRLMRLLRLAKVLRVVRVMKAFTSLRVLVRAVANSVGALAWSMTLLFVLELIGAIFLAQVLRPFMEDASIEDDLRDFIYAHFGTWSNAMFTIFEITMAPGGFARYRRLYEEVHPVFGVFFVVYVCVVTFAVVRVITAMFLKATLAASATDEQLTAENRAREHAEYMFALRHQLHYDEDAAAEHGGHVFTRGEFRVLVKDGGFKAFLSEVRLDPSTVRRAYTILEDGGNGVVLFDDWADAILQLARPLQHMDSIISFQESRSILRRVRALEQLLREGTRMPANLHALETGVSPACLDAACAGPDTIGKENVPRMRADLHALQRGASSPNLGAVGAGSDTIGAGGTPLSTHSEVIFVGAG